jgi:hypothetical protein
LKAIAALRQEIIATTIHRKIHQPGQAEGARRLAPGRSSSIEYDHAPLIIPIIANGRAKIECSNLIISR